MADQGGIDPRHDPIFQRGYDPAVHGGPRDEVPVPSTRRSRARRDADLDLFAPPSSQSPDASGTAAPGGVPPESRPRWGSDDPLPPPVAERPTRMVPPPGAPAEEEPEDFLARAPKVADAGEARSNPRTESRDTDAAPTAPWRNPYLLGLVIGGAVLAVAGFQMFRAALETIYVDFAQTGFIFGGGDTGSDEDADPTAELVSMQLGWSLGPLLFVVGLAAILAVVIFVAVRWRPVGRADERGPAADGGGDESHGNTDGTGARP
ncbi:hypothetical protein ELQ90_02710 [Labedella phragmitis]|uniref:Uncharacterized protein n=1 Tax=Labedella phragmitis TaxID=2498849 RepID=A0A3S4DP22_9MICO|nr:hypothetical protein [Labedella phragmitis]RWZ52868.1 hypothetical protein ELQ90_02710 [Labedella phragmitis]